MDFVGTNGKMKILVNASIYYGAKNGLGIYCEQVYRQLSTVEEFEINFFSFSKLSATSKKQDIIKYGFLQKIFSFGSLSLYRLMWNIIFLPIHARKYDLIYSLSPHGGLFIKNQVITIHDLIGLSHETTLFQKLYYKLLLPKIIRKSRRIITISSATKDKVIEKYGRSLVKKIHVLYNGVDHLSYFKPHSPKVKMPNSYDLVVGASYPHKNLPLIIEIYEKLLGSRNLVVICAKNNYTTSLKQRIERENISNISVLHNLENEELSWIYKNASLHLYLTLEEGFGFPPFEAAVYGTVSLISNIPSLQEIYGDSLPLVDPLNKEQIAKSILSFQHHDEILTRVRNRSKKFAWEEFRSNWINFISLETH